MLEQDEEIIRNIFHAPGQGNTSVLSDYPAEDAGSDIIGQNESGVVCRDGKEAERPSRLPADDTIGLRGTRAAGER